MQFITTGNRIAVENFEIGYFYTITMLSGNYFLACCTGIGSDFVMFSRDEPDLLFSLTIQSAADVSSIELYGGGSGTNDYNDLTNKPQINSITLTGNKSLSDLGIQGTISDLDSIRSGSQSGATAVQPEAMQAALALKQDSLDNTQLAAVNSGATTEKIDQIATNTADIALKQDAATAINTTNLESVAYALGKVTNLGDSADLNAITTIGNYYGNSNNILNRPGNIKTFRLIVQSDGNTVNYIEQIFNEYQGAKEYRRYTTTSVSSGNVQWSSWILVNDDLSALLASIAALENGT